MSIDKDLGRMGAPDARLELHPSAPGRIRKAPRLQTQSSTSSKLSSPPLHDGARVSDEAFAIHHVRCLIALR